MTTARTLARVKAGLRRQLRRGQRAGPLVASVLVVLAGLRAASAKYPQRPSPPSMSGSQWLNERAARAMPGTS